MKISNEVKTGIFVVVCVVAFGALAVKVGKFSFAKTGYTLKTRFHYSGGVKVHAPVCLSGVEVGEVKDIRLIYEDQTMVELDLWIREGVKIRTDSETLSSTFGLMGEKYIEIKAGTAGSDYATEGTLLKGNEPCRMEELVDIGKKVAGDISKTSNDISSVAKHVDEIVVENRPKINDMLDNFDETSVNFREFSDDVKYHPWKVLMKGKEVPKAERDRERAARLLERAKALGIPAPAAVTSAQAALDTPQKTEVSKQNFSSGKNF